MKARLKAIVLGSFTRGILALAQGGEVMGRTYADRVNSEQALGPGASADPVDPAESTAHDEHAGHKIVRGGIWRTGAFVFTSVLGVIALSIVSRTLGPSEFSIFVTIISIITVASVLSDIGLVQLGVREFSVNEPGERDRTQRALLTMRLVLSGVAALVMVAFVAYRGYSGSVMAGTLAAGIGLCGLAMQYANTVPLHAVYALRSIAIIEVARQFLYAVLTIIAAVVTGEVAVVIAVYLPLGLAMAVMSGMMARRITSIRPSWDPPAMRRLLGMVGVFALAGTIGAIYPYIAQVATDAVMEPFESGLFGLSFRAYVVAVGAGLVAISGAFPLLVVSSREDRKRFRNAVRRMIQASALLGAGLSAGLSAGAEFAVSLLGGKEFEGAAQSMSVIAWTTPASFILITGSSTLLAAGRNRPLIAVSIIGSSLSAALTVALAAAEGPTGAAAGILVGEALIAAGYVLAIRSGDLEACPRARWWGGWLLAIGAGLAVQLVPVPSLVSALLAGGTYTVVVFAARLVPPELLRPRQMLSGRPPEPAGG
jgi:O-antigen/teichoic acid export membrane protein